MSAALRLVLLVLLLAPAAARACVGAACMNVYASADRDGQLLLDWDFAARPVQTFQSLCAGGECLYSAIDPGFLSGAEPAPTGAVLVAQGVTVSLQLVAADPAVTVRINGTPLHAAGDRAVLGTIPTLHNHPSWQLRLPEGIRGEYTVTIRLTSDLPRYGSSPDYVVRITNLDPPTPTVGVPTPSPTATAVPPSCPGDCDGDGAVRIAELVQGVAAALGGGAGCTAFDTDGDARVSVAELVAAVGMALNGCAGAPTPTPTMPATFDAIQQGILSPRCAVPACHDAVVVSGNLNLEPDQAYDALVGVAPDIESARAAGLLRVDPMHPDNSFLLIKLNGPPPDQGSRMPLAAVPLSAAEIETIRAWIAAGAPR